jgi:hypothetical protein
MQASFDRHAGEEALERYSMGTLAESELEPVEEHLLICPTCQGHLEETDAYVQAARTAAAKLRGERRSSQWESRTMLQQLVGKRGMAWAAALALLLLPIAWFAGPWSPSRLPDSSPVAVVLQSARGVEGLVSSSAPKEEFLLLQVVLEIVDSKGSRVWEATSRPDDDRLSVPVSKRLKEGKYWVRLYAATPARELLREFGLQVE